MSDLPQAVAGSPASGSIFPAPADVRSVVSVVIRLVRCIDAAAFFNAAALFDFAVGIDEGFVCVVGECVES